MTATIARTGFQEAMMTRILVTGVLTAAMGLGAGHAAHAWLTDEAAGQAEPQQQQQAQPPQQQQAQPPQQQQQRQQQPRQAEGQRAQPAAAGTSLGSVRINRAVTANGQPLRPGTYQVRIGEGEVKPAPGLEQNLSQWVEFVQGGQVRGREVASVVPQAEIGQIAQVTPPRQGGSRVEMLKGNDYLRVWLNRGGTHYLIHLPPAS
jgi:hypothetical protein